MWRRAFRPRVSIRILMGLIVVLALAYLPVLLMIEPYRKEWKAEQKAIAEIRANAHDVAFTTVEVGPHWLHRLAWGHEHYFQRVRTLHFVGAGAEVYLLRRSVFHHVRLVMED